MQLGIDGNIRHIQRNHRSDTGTACRTSLGRHIGITGATGCDGQAGSVTKGGPTAHRSVHVIGGDAQSQARTHAGAFALLTFHATGICLGGGIGLIFRLHSDFAFGRHFGIVHLCGGLLGGHIYGNRAAQTKIAGAVACLRLCGAGAFVGGGNLQLFSFHTAAELGIVFIVDHLHSNTRTHGGRTGGIGYCIGDGFKHDLAVDRNGQTAGCGNAAGAVDDGVADGITHCNTQSTHKLAFGGLLLQLIHSCMTLALFQGNLGGFGGLVALGNAFLNRNFVVACFHIFEQGDAVLVSGNGNSFLAFCRKLDLHTADRSAVLILNGDADGLLSCFCIGRLGFRCFFLGLVVLGCGLRGLIQLFSDLLGILFGYGRLFSTGLVFHSQLYQQLQNVRHGQLLGFLAVLTLFGFFLGCATGGAGLGIGMLIGTNIHICATRHRCAVADLRHGVLIDHSYGGIHTALVLAVLAAIGRGFGIDVADGINLDAAACIQAGRIGHDHLRHLLHHRNSHRKGQGLFCGCLHGRLHLVLRQQFQVALCTEGRVAAHRDPAAEHRHIDRSRNGAGGGVHQNLCIGIDRDVGCADVRIVDRDGDIHRTNAGAILGAAIKQVQLTFHLFAPGDIGCFLGNPGLLHLSLQGEGTGQVHVKILEGRMQTLGCQLGQHQLRTAEGTGVVHANGYTFGAQQRMYVTFPYHTLGMDDDVCIGQIDHLVSTIASCGGNCADADLQPLQAQTGSDVQGQIGRRTTLDDADLAAFRNGANGLDTADIGKDQRGIVLIFPHADVTGHSDLIVTDRNVLRNGVSCGAFQQVGASGRRNGQTYPVTFRLLSYRLGRIRLCRFRLCCFRLGRTRHPFLRGSDLRSR